MDGRLPDPALPPVGRPLPLLLCLIASGFAALSIHVGMLLAGVGYPVARPPGWAGWLAGSGGLIAVLIVQRLAWPRIGRWRFAGQWLIAFVIFTTIRETLRGVTMNALVTEVWAPSLAGLPGALARTAITTLACTIVVRWLRGPVVILIAGLLLGALLMAVMPAITALFRPLVDRYASLARPDAYQFPYPAKIQIPAYLTYLEAVLGATLIAMLVWERLPGGVLARAAQLALLVALMKGVLVGTFLLSFFMAVPAPVGMLRYSQFLLEFLALGALTGLSWHRFGADRGD